MARALMLRGCGRFGECYAIVKVDIQCAEKQLMKALPKMAKAATNEDLKEAYESHLEETEGQIERLETIFKQLDVSYARVDKCKAMEGLIEEGESLMEEGLEPDVLDAGLICAAQKVEHYEIAGYGCARTFAQQLGHSDIAELLQKTLDEEGNADKKLTEIAESVVNQDAETARVGDEEQVSTIRMRKTGNWRPEISLAALWLQSSPFLADYGDVAARSRTAYL